MFHSKASKVFTRIVLGASVGLLSADCLAQGSGFAKAGTQNAGSNPPVATDKQSKDVVPIDRMRHFDGSVHDAILTVDGLVAKVGMNYAVDAPMLYFFVPGVGTVVVAQTKFANASLEKNVVKGSVLTVEADGHQVQVTNDGPLFKHVDRDLWVALDKGYATAAKMPMMGYGAVPQAPYKWPDAKSALTQTTAAAPPVPMVLRPKMASSSSYTVSVRPGDSGR
jgi:hypothetical protein